MKANLTSLWNELSPAVNQPHVSNVFASADLKACEWQHEFLVKQSLG
jgi:hypothetical protein